MLGKYFDDYASSYKPYKRGSWCYEDGCLYRGLECLHRATAEDRWLNHMIRLVDAQLTPGPGLAGYNPSDYNIDHIKSGWSLLYLFEQTGQSRYLDATAPLLQQLNTHPRTKSGVFWHKLAYPWQIWLDGLYMACPFRIGYGQITHQPDMIDDALSQLATALKLTHDAPSGLYFHAYDEARMQQWADPITGHSPAFWSRSMGWLAMCLVDIAELVGPAQFEPFRQQAVDLFARLHRLRQPNGLWLQVIDLPDLTNNYQEASASAMFTYATLKAVKLGLCAAPDEDLLQTLITKTLRPSPDGLMQMQDICGVAGLGKFGEVYRDGSPDYYVKEPLIPDDIKGVGPLMMAVAAGDVTQKDAALSTTVR